MSVDIDWEKIKRMTPYLRFINNRWEASVGTGFETCWWPEGTGKTKEEALQNLKKELAKV